MFKQEINMHNTYLFWYSANPSVGTTGAALVLEAALLNVDGVTFLIASACKNNQIN